MRKTLFVPLVAAFALAGCGGGGADKNGDGKISTEEVAAEAKGAVKPRPGQYETKIQLLEIELPEVAGLDPKQMKDMMQQQMNTTSNHCVTAQDAEDAAKQMLQTPDQANCSYTKFSVAGGAVDAELSCKGPDGSTSTMHLSGEMGTEASKMVMSVDQVVPAAPGLPKGGKSHLKMQVDSRRIGECT